MIYCVWYPSGGFGHFVNAVLTLHGNNFMRPKKSLGFSSTGDSHSLDLIAPKYTKDCWPGGIEFLDDKNYCVLVDNGIDNESDLFKSEFPGAVTIKICYCKYSWPVVARTMIEKAMRSSIKKQLPIDGWNTDEPWAHREKYFLYLRDHPLRSAWRESDENSLDVAELYVDYEECHTILNSIVKTGDFHNLWAEWRKANAKYIDPVVTANTVLSYVLAKQSKDLTDITDIWTQAVVYYYIWLKYNIEIPHNDFADFFTNTDQIQNIIA
jgi:hypothetical protein